MREEAEGVEQGLEMVEEAHGLLQGQYCGQAFLDPAAGELRLCTSLQFLVPVGQDDKWCVACGQRSSFSGAPPSPMERFAPPTTPTYPEHLQHVYTLLHQARRLDFSLKNKSLLENMRGEMVSRTAPCATLCADGTTCNEPVWDDTPCPRCGTCKTTFDDSDRTRALLFQPSDTVVRTTLHTPLKSEGLSKSSGNEGVPTAPRHETTEGGTSSPRKRKKKARTAPAPPPSSSEGPKRAPKPRRPAATAPKKTQAAARRAQSKRQSNVTLMPAIVLSTDDDVSSSWPVMPLPVPKTTSTPPRKKPRPVAAAPVPLTVAETSPIPRLHTETTRLLDTLCRFWPTDTATRASLLAGHYTRAMVGHEDEIKMTGTDASVRTYARSLAYFCILNTGVCLFPLEFLRLCDDPARSARELHLTRADREATVAGRVLRLFSNTPLFLDGFSPTATQQDDPKSFGEAGKAIRRLLPEVHAAWETASGCHALGSSLLGRLLRTLVTEPVGGEAVSTDAVCKFWFTLVTVFDATHAAFVPEPRVRASLPHIIRAFQRFTVCVCVSLRLTIGILSHLKMPLHIVGATAVAVGRSKASRVPAVDDLARYLHIIPSAFPRKERNAKSILGIDKKTTLDVWARDTMAPRVREAWAALDRARLDHPNRDLSSLFPLVPVARIPLQADPWPTGTATAVPHRRRRRRRRNGRRHPWGHHFPVTLAETSEEDEESAEDT